MRVRKGYIDAFFADAVFFEVVSVMIKEVFSAGADKGDGVREEGDAVVGKDGAAAEPAFCEAVIGIPDVVDDGDAGCDVAVCKRTSSIFPSW